MWLRFTLFDVRVVAHYLGVLVSFFTIALAVPLVVAIAMKEWEPASRYLLAVGISLIVGSGLRLLCVQPGKLTHQQALAVTGLSWIGLAFVAFGSLRSVPRLPYGSGFRAYHHGRYARYRPGAPFYRRQHVALRNAPYRRLGPYCCGSFTGPFGQGNFGPVFFGRSKRTRAA